MPTFTSDTLRVSDFVAYEGSQEHTRDQITILAGGGSDRVLTAGMVLGKTLISATEASAPGGSNTGDGVMGAVVAGKFAKAGLYTLVCIAVGTDVGTFEVRDPEGLMVKSALGLDLVVAVAFVSDHFTVTLADGSADFVLGDTFVITISALVHKWERHVPGGTDGTERAAGLLLVDRTALAASDIEGLALTRGPAIINKDQIIHAAGATAAQIEEVEAEFLRLNIVPQVGTGFFHFGA